MVDEFAGAGRPLPNSLNTAQLISTATAGIQGPGSTPTPFGPPKGPERARRGPKVPFRAPKGPFLARTALAFAAKPQARFVAASA